MKVRMIWLSESHSVVSNSLQPHGLQPTRFLCSQDFPGKNTGVGCHFLLQGIFPTQGSKPYIHISIYPMQSVSCIGRQILYYYTIWEALPHSKIWEEPLQLPSNNLPRIWLIWDWVVYLYHPEGCVGAELSSPETPPSPWICLHLFRGRNPRNPISRCAWCVCVCVCVCVCGVVWCLCGMCVWCTQLCDSLCEVVSRFRLGS